MLPPKINLPADQRELLQLYKGLGERDRAALLAFAQFLSCRDATDSAAPEPPLQEPKTIPRPDQESVVAAIRRLSESYFMLDRAVLLNETSSLMTAHIMHGRPAGEVIDELERLFADQYARLRGDAPQ